jgi:hypothetical protein
MGQKIHYFDHRKTAKMRPKSNGNASHNSMDADLVEKLCDVFWGEALEGNPNAMQKNEKCDKKNIGRQENPLRIRTTLK